MLYSSKLLHNLVKEISPIAFIVTFALISSTTEEFRFFIGEMKKKYFE